ncbi:MAPEG family protein [Lysobacter korlensis]|uniref:MAPEG family protein n=1 Tax=Lysobacter korlensis TaxID=553636 RepID=A0ABV6RR49_9GAMM
MAVAAQPARPTLLLRRAKSLGSLCTRDPVSRMSISIAYWCVLAAALQPYLWILVAKLPRAGGDRYDNRDPRIWLAHQTDPRTQRANAAHQNSFEAFGPFAAGVVLAQVAGVDHTTIASLAVAFVLLRLCFGIFYLTGRSTLRSLVWAAAFACVIALLAQAAWAAAAAAATATVPASP